MMINKKTVTIDVNLYGEATDAKEVYVSGCTPELGQWDPSKALRLRKKGNRYQASVEMANESAIEFKVLSKRDWSGVEKGMHGEELSNHCINTNETTNYEVDVQKWNC